MHTPAIRHALRELDHASRGWPGLHLVRWAASPWVVRWALGELPLTGVGATDLEREPAHLWTRMVAADRDRLRREFVAIDTAGVVQYRITSRSGAEQWIRETVRRVTSDDGQEAFVSFARELAVAPTALRPRRPAGWESAGDFGPGILVVEDDAPVRSVIVRMLRREGHDVIEAGSTREALRIWDRTPNPIRVLITDVILPDRPGTDLARVLRRRSPGMHTIFVSGYAEEALRARVGLPDDVVFLAKPFRPRELVRTVRDVLELPLGGGGAVEGPRSAV